MDNEREGQEKKDEISKRQPALYQIQKQKQ